MFVKMDYAEFRNSKKSNSPYLLSLRLRAVSGHFVDVNTYPGDRARSKGDYVEGVKREGGIYTAVLLFPHSGFPFPAMSVSHPYLKQLKGKYYELPFGRCIDYCNVEVRLCSVFKTLHR